MTPISKRARVLAALRGDPVDRPPFGFWAHNYAMENSAADLTAETVRVLTELDFDFLKLQTRAQAFEEAFGAVWRASGERAVEPTPVRYAVASPADFGAVRPADWTTGPLGEQLEALRMIRAAVGDVPVICTVFNPLMIARRLQPGDVAGLQAAMIEHPKALRSALDAVTATMTGFVQAAVAAGADGLFYATNVATEGLLTADEYRQWGVDDDLTILAAVADAPFNMLHTCGEAVHFDPFIGYPVHVFNYAVGKKNPSLGALAARTGKAVAGGISTKPHDVRLSLSDVIREVNAAVESTSGRFLLIAPGCSNTPSAADIVGAAGRDAIRGLAR